MPAADIFVVMFNSGALEDYCGGDLAEAIRVLSANENASHIACYGDFGDTLLFSIIKGSNGNFEIMWEG